MPLSCTVQFETRVPASITKPTSSLSSAMLSVTMLLRCMVMPLLVGIHLRGYVFMSVEIPAYARS